MKRSLEESTELDHSLTMANCLMLLSQGRDYDGVKVAASPSVTRAFECKTCNRQFQSFQALGGHRASHKKPRPLNGAAADTQQMKANKTHECSVCGLEFAIGQALGGHMRRHNRVAAFRISDTAPFVKKANDRRVLFLDLNLTPYENDLEFCRLGSGSNKSAEAAPIVHCFL